MALTAYRAGLYLGAFRQADQKRVVFQAVLHRSEDVFQQFELFRRIFLYGNQDSQPFPAMAPDKVRARGWIRGGNYFEVEKPVFQNIILFYLEWLKQNRIKNRYF